MSFSFIFIVCMVRSSYPVVSSLLCLHPQAAKMSKFSKQDLLSGKSRLMPVKVDIGEGEDDDGSPGFGVICMHNMMMAAMEGFAHLSNLRELHSSRTNEGKKVEGRRDDVMRLLLRRGEAQ